MSINQPYNKMLEELIHKPHIFKPMSRSLVKSCIPSLMLLLIIYSSLMLLSNGQSLSSAESTNCSTTGRCSKCMNDFICLECATQKVKLCCPKYCKQCNNNMQCTSCELGFEIKTYEVSNWTLCVYTNRIDYNRDPANTSRCVEGYYLETYTNYCEKCPFQNCQYCSDSRNCLMCADGYLLKNGLCFQQEGNIQQQQSVKANDQKSDYLNVFNFGLTIGICIGNHFFNGGTCCLKWFNKMKEKVKNLFSGKKKPEEKIQLNEQIQSTKGSIDSERK